MASFSDLKPFLFLLVLLHMSILLLSLPVHSNEKEDNLLQGIDSYRTSQRLPPLTKNSNANCAANELADKLKDQRCTNGPSASKTKLTDYPKIISKCNIDLNSTTKAAIMPVCVRHLVPTLVLTNYTHTSYVRNLNDSTFTGVGVGSEDDWMVVILTTNNPKGLLANGAQRITSKNGLGQLLVILFIGLSSLLVN